MEPPPGAPVAGQKSATAFFGVLLAIYLAAQFAQAAQRVTGLVATQLFAFLLPAIVATAGSNVRVGRYLRLSAPRPALLALGALAGLAGALVAAAIMTATERVLPRSWVETYDLARTFHGPPWERTALAVAAATLAPACEEITFRGYVQTTLLLDRRPPIAIAASTALFALLHLDPVRFPALLPLGAIFGWIAWRSGSVWPSVAAHVANNGLAVVLFLASGSDATRRPSLVDAAGLLAVGAAVLALVVRAVRALAPPPGPAADAVELRDPALASIRFDLRRVPPLLAAAAVGGLAFLLALAALGAARLVHAR